MRQLRRDISLAVLQARAYVPPVSKSTSKRAASQTFQKTIKFIFKFIFTGIVAFALALIASSFLAGIGTPRWIYSLASLFIVCSVWDWEWD
jgi:hypothetical protein